MADGNQVNLTGKIIDTIALNDTTGIVRGICIEIGNNILAQRDKTIAEREAARVSDALIMTYAFLMAFTMPDAQNRARQAAEAGDRIFEESKHIFRLLEAVLACARAGMPPVFHPDIEAALHRAHPSKYRAPAYTSS